MDIIQWNFRAWCQKATSLIKFSPDRRVVEAELRQHLDDSYESLLEKGLSQEEASAKTLDAMGDPLDIAPQLAAIHRPFWGYFLRACRIVFIILLCLCIIYGWDYQKQIDFSPSYLQNVNIYSPDAYGGDTGRTLLHLSQPNTSFSTDGSTFTLTDAAVFTKVQENTGEENTQLFVLIRQDSLLPYQERATNVLDLPITAWFVVKDDLGNEYPFYSGGGWRTRAIKRGIFSCVYECWINDFPPEASWAEICYERDGRSYALRIDLTGGAVK